MRGKLLWALAALSLLGAGTATEDAERRDLKKKQGPWKVETVVVGGEVVSAKVAAKFALTIKGNQLIPIDSPKDASTVKLDPTQKPPAIYLTGRTKKVVPGIYEIDGDRLKLCFAEPGRPRPKKFESPKMFEPGKNNTIIYVVLEREKE